MGECNASSSSGFLLKNETARKLFNEVKDLPIIDYHCHLSVNDIISDRVFSDITEMWLESDHYKWRLMRMGGVDEDFITGKSTNFEKFEKYLEVLSVAIGSPLYHWSKLELKQYFDVEDEILPKNIKTIYEKANNTIAKKKLSALKILEMSNVEKVCIVEDALSLDENAYKKVKQLNIKTDITPIFRADKLLLLDSQEVKRVTPALLDKFVSVGCASADFGVEYISDADDEFIEKYSYILNECYSRGFVVQLHFGAMRNNNKLMFEKLGADKGFDSISEKPFLSALAKIFAKTDKVGKTVIFSLNPSYNALLGTFVENFADGGIKGKVQIGAPWWFNDNKDGINEFFKTQSNMSLLNASVGMLTDSRSLISYARHEYFRRLLCNYVGQIAESGEFTTDFNTLKTIVANVSYYNIKEFLK